MSSCPSMCLVVGVSNRADRPCDLKKTEHWDLVSLAVILIFPRGWLYSAESISAVAGSGLLCWSTWNYRWITSCEISISFQQHLSRMAALMYQVEQFHYCKKNVFSFQSCSCVSRPKQSIDSSFLRCHMAFCVILGRSTEMNGGWWLVSTSASPGVWNARLFPAESNITWSGTFNTTYASHNPAVTHPMWLVRNEISSSLRTWVDSWTLRLNFWGRKEGGVNISSYH